MILPDAIAADCNLRTRLIERLEIGRLKPCSSADYMLRERLGSDRLFRELPGHPQCIATSCCAQLDCAKSRGRATGHAEFVFTYRGRQTKSIHNWGWKLARERAGLRQVRVHDLCHTWGDRLRATGVSRCYYTAPGTGRSRSHHQDGHTQYSVPIPLRSHLHPVLNTIKR